MKKFLFSLFLVLVCFSASAFFNPGEYSLIINLAGRQRMLTQKMIKESLLIYGGIDVEKNRENLKGTTWLFKKTLNGLRNGDPSLGLLAPYSDSIKAQLDVVDSLFREVEFIFERVISGEAPSRDAILELAEKSPFILENMDMVVQMYELESRNIISGDVAFLGIEVNLSGKQRMLSQKMAKECLFIYLDIDRRTNKSLLRETCGLFDKTLKGLKSGDGDLGLPPCKDVNIINEIDNAIGIWWELKPIIERSYDVMVDRISKEEIESVAKQNVLLLEQIDKIVKMYEGLAKK